MSSIPSPRAKEAIRSAPGRSIERRHHSESLPSRITVPSDTIARKMSTPNQDVKSKNCSSELNKPEFCWRLSRNDSAPAKRHESKDSARAVEELRHKDVIFLRKMLAINKKQEMMLNKRLARLMDEEQSQDLTEGRGRNKRVVEQPPPTAPPSPPPTSPPTPGIKAGKQSKDSICAKNESNVIVSKPTNENPSPETRVARVSPPAEERVARVTPSVKEIITSTITPAKKIQYDMNGRRIYHYSDIEKDSGEEESEQKQGRNDILNPKRVENSLKVNKKLSPCSKKTFTMKKSLTYINNQSRALKKAPVKTKRKVRKEDGDSPSRSNSENPIEFELRPKKVGCQGDGVEIENVIVHCSTVYKNHSASNKNRKVWNYESLHSMMSDKSLEKNKTVSSDQGLSKAGECNRTSQRRPISVNNNHGQIKNPAISKDERGSKTVETMLLVRKK